MKFKNLLLLAIVSMYSNAVSATIGNKIDALVDKTHKCYERILLDARFATGVVPPLTIENIKKHPEHKHDYIAYAAAHINEIDRLVLAALLREYPADIGKHLADLIKQKLTGRK